MYIMAKWHHLLHAVSTYVKYLNMKKEMQLLVAIVILQNWTVGLTSLTITPKYSLRIITDRNILLKSPKSKLSYTNKYCSRSWQEDVQPNLFQMAVMDGCVIIFIWFPRQWCLAFTGHHLKCFALKTNKTVFWAARQVFWWAYSLLECHDCRRKLYFAVIIFSRNCLSLTFVTNFWRRTQGALR